MAVIPFLLVVFVLGMHGVGHLAAARMCGHDVPRPRGYFIPGWGCFRCGQDRARRWWTRPIVHIGGLIGSYLGMAALVFVAVFALGVKDTHGHWQVRETQAGFDAAGKLQPGDIVTKVNDQVVVAPYLPIPPIVERAGGAVVRVEIVRAGKTMQVEIQPRLDTASDRQRLGVALVMKIDDVTLSLSNSLWEALVEPGRQIWMNIDIFTGREALDLGGPVAIAEAFETALRPGLFAIQIALRWSSMIVFLLVAVEVIAAVTAAIQRRSAAA